MVVASAIAAAVRDLLSNSLSGLSYGRLLANLASIFILGLGVIAALNQIGIALTVTLPVLITILATLGGILVVGVGGGLIKPMQGRWENYLQKADEERRALRDRGQSANFAETSTQYSSHAQPPGNPPAGPPPRAFGDTPQQPGTSGTG